MKNVIEKLNFTELLVKVNSTPANIAETELYTKQSLLQTMFKNANNDKKKAFLTSNFNELDKLPLSDLELLMYSKKYLLKPAIVGAPKLVAKNIGMFWHDRLNFLNTLENVNYCDEFGIELNKIVLVNMLIIHDNIENANILPLRLLPQKTINEFFRNPRAKKFSLLVKSEIRKVMFKESKDFVTFELLRKSEDKNGNLFYSKVLNHQTNLITSIIKK